MSEIVTLNTKYKTAFELININKLTGLRKAIFCDLVLQLLI